MSEQIAALLTRERIAFNLEAGSKKRVLEQISAVAVSGLTGISATEVFEALINREKLGSTGVGNGIAIPHGRLQKLDQAVGAFAKLSSGIDYDAHDRVPVDLLFVLLVPGESTADHLNILAELAEMFSDQRLCEQLRNSSSQDDLLDLIRNWSRSQANAKTN